MRWLSVRREYRMKQEQFEDSLYSHLELAARKAFETDYSEEHVSQISRVLQSDQIVRGKAGPGLLLFLIVIAVAGFGLTSTDVAWGIAVQLGGLIGATGMAGLMTISSSRLKRTRSTDAVRVAYQRDGSVPSLKRDLEYILSLLRDDPDAHKEFRLVVVLDELDKLESNEMLDAVIEQFKNLFTLSKASFVFVTGKEYFDYVEDIQRLAVRSKSYAKHHTFFTQKIFLSRADFQDVEEFLRSIVAVERPETDNPVFGLEWERRVKYLTYASKSHFFDLVKLLHDLRNDTGGLGSEEVIKLATDEANMEALQRRYGYESRVQILIEFTYNRHRSFGQGADRQNGELLADLYSFVANPGSVSFAVADGRRRGTRAETDDRGDPIEALKKLLGSRPVKWCKSTSSC